MRRTNGNRVKESGSEMTDRRNQSVVSCDFYEEKLGVDDNIKIGDLIHRHKIYLLSIIPHFASIGSTGLRGYENGTVILKEN